MTTKKMNAKELVQYVIENWVSITGTSVSAMHDEGNFPNEVDDMIEASGVDYDAFQSAWFDALEGDNE